MVFAQRGASRVFEWQAKEAGEAGLHARWAWFGLRVLRKEMLQQRGEHGVKVRQLHQKSSLT